MSHAPGNIRVGHRNYYVVHRHGRQLSARGENGSTDNDERRIEISDDLRPEPERETVLHEVLHALTDVTGVRSDLGDDDEEKLVTRLAPALLALLWDNPALVAYLADQQATR